MARFSGGAGGGEGTPGPAGADGQGFNFRGEFVNGTTYNKYDIVSGPYNGNLYYLPSGTTTSFGSHWYMFVPEGSAGAPGADGADGADAIWNFTGEYSGGAAYAVGDLATYNGELWYRYNSNGGNVGDTPSPGLWNLLAAKGTDGADGADGSDGSPGLVYLGNYVSGNGYIANVAVVKGSDNNLYIATSSGGLGDPVGNTAEWAIFLPKGADGSSGTSGLETSTRYSPVFTATGLTFTGSGATYPTYNSYYVKAGKLVSFVIEVDLSTVTNFGTGQYKLQLPFTPAVGYNHFPGWAQVDVTVNPDVPNGHIILNVDHAGVTDVLDIHYLKQAGGANSGIIEGLFLQGTPVTLTTASKIYINGTYIAAS